jgi:hypothetical protein
MSVRLIITEQQYKSLEKRLSENRIYTSVVEKLKNDLDMNYEPIVGVIRKGGEYVEKPMIKIKVDGESITPKALFDYLKYKYKLGDEFIKQVVTDWSHGRIKNNNLSKNVALSDGTER